MFEVVPPPRNKTHLPFSGRSSYPWGKGCKIGPLPVISTPPKNFYEATAIWETNVKNSWRNPPKNFCEATAIWETNVKNSWRNPPKNFCEATAIWETNVKNSWQNPPQNLFWSNCHLQRNRRRLWEQCKELFGEHSKEHFGRQKPFAAKQNRRQTCHFAPRCPKDFTMAALGEMQ